MVPTVKIVKTKKGEEFIIDEEDYEKISYYCWHMTSQGYMRATTKRKDHPERKQRQILLHRFIMNLNDRSIQIDHINRNPLDNRKCNLRFCNQSQNQANTGLLKRNKCRIKGVCFKSGKYEAYIWKSQQIYLGRFETKIEAAKAYDKAAIELFGEFALLNEDLE